MILFNHTWTWCGSSRRLRDTMRLCTNLEAFYGYSDPSSYPVGNCPWIALWDLGNTPSNPARCPLVNIMGICILRNIFPRSLSHLRIISMQTSTRNCIAFGLKSFLSQFFLGNEKSFFESIYLARIGYISWFSETNFYLLHKQHFKGIHHICHIHIFKWAEPLTSILNLPISLLTCLFFFLESSMLSLCETANKCPDQSQVKNKVWRPIPQVTIRWQLTVEHPDLMVSQQCQVLDKLRLITKWCFSLEQILRNSPALSPFIHLRLAIAALQDYYFD